MDEGYRVFVEVSQKALEIQKYMDIVRDDAAGAIATFSGVTRNEFQGKKVLQLEYEAYSPMAVAKMKVCGVLVVCGMQIIGCKAGSCAWGHPCWIAMAMCVCVGGGSWGLSLSGDGGRICAEEGEGEQMFHCRWKGWNLGVNSCGSVFVRQEGVV